MSRDIRQLCRETRHCPRYQAKRRPEAPPGAVFMPFGNTFRNISVGNGSVETDYWTPVLARPAAPHMTRADTLLPGRRPPKLPAAQCCNTPHRRRAKQPDWALTVARTRGQTRGQGIRTLCLSLRNRS
jgi:hypothetical protein